MSCLSKFSWSNMTCCLKWNPPMRFSETAQTFDDDQDLPIFSISISYIVDKLWGTQSCGAAVCFNLTWTVLSRMSFSTCPWCARAAEGKLVVLFRCVTTATFWSSLKLHLPWRIIIIPWIHLLSDQAWGWPEGEDSERGT